MIRGVLTNLRAIEQVDAIHVHRWYNEPVVMEGWGQSVAAASLTIVGEQVAGWIDGERKGRRPIAFIIETLDAQPIGLIVAPPLDRERRVVHLSFLIGTPDDWGQGYGGDALDAFLDAAFDGWNLYRIELEVEAGNERARRLYSRAGFRDEATLRGARARDGERFDLLLMGVTAPEWRARRADIAPPSRAQDPYELFDVVSANGEPMGHAKPRWQVHRDGDWHRAVHVWICGIDDGVGFLDFQRRGAEKDTWPGALDATVGGHLTAGESLPDAMREVEEEIGIAIEPASLVWGGTRRGVSELAADRRDRELQDVHLVRLDLALEDYRPNRDEVAGIVRVNLSDAIALLLGEVDSIACRVVTPNAPAPAESTLTSVDFIPSVDRYFLRVALAAERLLAGQGPIVV